jgi:hypothetical protein
MYLYILNMETQFLYYGGDDDDIDNNHIFQISFSFRFEPF